MCAKRFAGRNFKKEKKIKKNGWLDIGASALIVLCLAVFVAGGVYYLSMVNANATRSYVVGDLKDEIDRLNIEGEKAEMAIVKLRETARIEEIARGMAMEKDEEFEFLQTRDGQVAKR